MKKNTTPKHSGFDAPVKGTALPKGTKFVKNPDGTIRPVEPKNTKKTK